MPVTASQLHKWVERNRLVDRTLRQCMRFGLWKITRHEPDNDPPHWVEWYRDKVRVAGDLTPACTGVGDGAMARSGEAATGAPVSRVRASASSSPSVPEKISG